MFKKARPAQDAFTFSLGGMTTISAVVAPRAIAVDCPCANRPRRRKPNSGNYRTAERLRARFSRAVAS